MNKELKLESYEEPTVKRTEWINVYRNQFGVVSGDRKTLDAIAQGGASPRIGVLRLDLMSDGTVRTEMEDV